MRPSTRPTRCATRPRLAGLWPVSERGTERSRSSAPAPARARPPCDGALWWRRGMAQEPAAPLELASLRGLLRARLVVARHGQPASLSVTGAVGSRLDLGRALEQTRGTSDGAGHSPLMTACRQVVLPVAAGTLPIRAANSAAVRSSACAPAQVREWSDEGYPRPVSCPDDRNLRRASPVLSGRPI